MLNYSSSQLHHLLQSCSLARKLMETVQVPLPLESDLGEKKPHIPEITLNFTQMTCGSNTVSSEERHHERSGAKSSGELYHSAPKHACHISNSLTANMPPWTAACFLQSRRGGKATKFILALKLMSKITWWANEIILWRTNSKIHGNSDTFLSHTTQAPCLINEKIWRLKEKKKIGEEGHTSVASNR